MNNGEPMPISDATFVGPAPQAMADAAMEVAGLLVHGGHPDAAAELVRQLRATCDRIEEILRGSGYDV